ncbi:hypothetical protein F4604DRAFT_1720411 [Suillus subluteus]|nr:hypothetical protein F4604DRAFT_1720411 [Suillus subluteus]
MLDQPVINVNHEVLNEHICCASANPSSLPPPLAAETSQIRFSSQPHAGHNGNTHHPADQPPTRQLTFLSLHSHSSSPLPLSCRWLRDDTVCGFTGTLGELKAHCKISHLLVPQICRFNAAGKLVTIISAMTPQCMPCGSIVCGITLAKFIWV